MKEKIMVYEIIVNIPENIEECIGCLLKYKVMGGERRSHFLRNIIIVYYYFINFIY